MGDIFGGIDLAALANSEEAIVDTSNMESEIDEVIADTTEETIPEQTPTLEGGIDISILAEAEETEIPSGTSAEEEDIEGKEGKEKTSSTPAAKDKGSSPSSQETLTSLASALVEAGVFSSLSEEETTEIADVESLLSAMEKEIKTSRYADLNEGQKKYLEAMENGVPHESFVEKAADADQYRNLDDTKIAESPALAAELIRRSFLVKGIDEATASRYAKLAVDAGTAGADAVAAKQELIKHTEGLFEKEISDAKAATEATRLKDAETLARMKSKINETSEIIPGTTIKVNATTKDKIFSSLTDVADVVNDAPRNEVMKAYAENPEYKTTLHALHVITKGFTDFSKFSKVSTSTATQALKDKLAQGGSGVTGKASPSGNGSGIVGSTTTDMAKHLASMK